ncbi:MAG: response regulator, partial [Chitinivibrionales bacterium]|nr:response regulator [Chitinivibrionales bacterium]
MKNILVVDNHPVILQFMKGLLEKQGHEVKTADGALAALTLLEKFTPDVIFVDLVMPYISGDKLCRILRTIPTLRNCYVIILSAVAAEEEVDFKNFGADACIAKGLFDKMGEHVVSVLDRLEEGEGTDLGDKIIGSEDVYQREISKELLSSKKHFEVILNNLSEGILVLTLEGRIINANPTAVTILGTPEEKLLAAQFAALFAGNHKQRVETALAQIETGPQKIDDHDPLFLDDRQITFHMVPVEEDEQQCIIVILHDVTQRKRMELHLQQAQKMKAIATLAGGIAHEFNNALCGITGNIELMQMDLPQDERIIRYADAIRVATERIAHLTNQLLAYGQGGKYYPRIVSLKDFAEDTLSIVRHNIDPAITVKTDFSKSDSAVKVDLTQMQMVLTTLLNNASEGIENGGSITVSTQDVTVDEQITRVHPGVSPGPYVCLTVKDNGVGMDKETQTKI